MRKKSVVQHVVAYEVIGFALVTAFLWLDEILDLPHWLMGAPATPVNWRESFFESLLALMLGAVVVVVTRQFLRRVKYLEGFLLFCAGCKRVRYHAQWIPIDVFVREHSEADITHGLCPDCLEQYCGDWGGPPHRQIHTDHGQSTESDTDVMHFAPCGCAEHAFSRN